MNAEGQNTIYVYGTCANMTMTPEDVINAKRRYNQCRLCTSQLEVTIPAIISAFEIAKAHGDDSIKSCTSESIT